MNQKFDILKPILLGFLDQQDQSECIIDPGSGHLEFDGNNIVFIRADGQKWNSTSTNNTIDHYLERDSIKQRMNHTYTSLMLKLIDDAIAAGLIFEETIGGCRIYEKNLEAEQEGRFGYGVDILLNENGGFHSASRIDVDLSLTTNIRTIKAVRKMFNLL